jgi:hypothetical protein
LTTGVPSLDEGVGRTTLPILTTLSAALAFTDLWFAGVTGVLAAFATAVWLSRRSSPLTSGRRPVRPAWERWIVGGAAAAAGWTLYLGISSLDWSIRSATLAASMVALWWTDAGGAESGS